MTPVPAKLGALEDIEHDLDDLTGQTYGVVVQVLRRLTPAGEQVSSGGFLRLSKIRWWQSLQLLIWRWS